jgi:hypothetical protein
VLFLLGFEILITPLERLVQGSDLLVREPVCLIDLIPQTGQMALAACQFFTQPRHLERIGLR